MRDSPEIDPAGTRPLRPAASAAPEPPERLRAGPFRFAVLTLGCKLNKYDSAVVAGGLKAAGGSAGTYREADLVVLNTCTVTHKADRDVRKQIHRVRRENQEAFIAVAGCYARREPRRLREMPEVDAVLESPDAVRSFLAGLRPEAAGMEAPILPDFGDRTRAFLKVQEGCRMRCAYCIIPAVRGPSRSVPREAVLEEFRGLLAEGYREIVLTGINTGDWGLDLEPRRRLADLLEDLLTVPGEFRIRLNSLEPKTVTPRVVGLLASEPRFAPHLQVPLQSGSDRVLRAMRRNYRADTYRRVIECLAGAVTGLGLGADVLAGYPGESKEDHRETLNLIRDLPLAFLHVFGFSPREGTPAADLQPLPPNVVADRNREIRELGEAKARAFTQSQMGRTLTGLTLGPTGDGTACALTGNFLMVRLPGEPAVPNRFVPLRVTDFSGGRIRGEILERES